MIDVTSVCVCVCVCVCVLGRAGLAQVGAKSWTTWRTVGLEDKSNTHTIIIR